MFTEQRKIQFFTHCGPIWDQTECLLLYCVSLRTKMARQCRRQEQGNSLQYTLRPVGLGGDTELKSNLIPVRRLQILIPVCRIAFSNVAKASDPIYYWNKIYQNYFQLIQKILIYRTHWSPSGSLLHSHSVNVGWESREQNYCEK